MVAVKTPQQPCDILYKKYIMLITAIRQFIPSGIMLGIRSRLRTVVIYVRFKCIYIRKYTPYMCSHSESQICILTIDITYVCTRVQFKAAAWRWMQCLHVMMVESQINLQVLLLADYFH